MVSKTDHVSNIRTAVSETMDNVLKHAMAASVVITAAAAEVLAAIAASAVTAPIDIAAIVSLHFVIRKISHRYMQYHGLYCGGNSSSNERTPLPVDS